MGDLGRRVQRERERLRQEDRARAAWSKSPFTTGSAIVRVPTGNFAAFVEEVLPQVDFWCGYVGKSPDGLVRVTRSRSYLRYNPATGGVVERRSWRLSRCRLFGVEVAGSCLVVLKDGRGGYTGSLPFWHRVIAAAIASGEQDLRLSSRGEWQSD